MDGLVDTTKPARGKALEQASVCGCQTKEDDALWLQLHSRKGTTWAERCLVESRRGRGEKSACFVECWSFDGGISCGFFGVPLIKKPNPFFVLRLLLRWWCTCGSFWWDYSIIGFKWCYFELIWRTRNLDAECALWEIVFLPLFSIRRMFSIWRSSWNPF